MNPFFENGNDKKSRVGRVSNLWRSTQHSLEADALKNYGKSSLLL